MKKKNRPVHDGALVTEDGHDGHHVEHAQEGGAGVQHPHDVLHRAHRPPCITRTINRHANPVKKNSQSNRSCVEYVPVDSTLCCECNKHSNMRVMYCSFSAAEDSSVCALCGDPLQCGIAALRNAAADFCLVIKTHMVAVHGFSSSAT